LQGILTQQFINVIQHAHFRTIDDNYFHVPVFLMKKALQRVVVTATLQAIVGERYNCTD
jgi:hypothetical protein